MLIFLLMFKDIVILIILANVVEAEMMFTDIVILLILVNVL